MPITVSSQNLVIDMYVLVLRVKTKNKSEF